MNGEQIIDKFKLLVDDAPSDDLCLDLLNTVKDIVESDRPWRMLIKEDTSQTFGTSDTYLTAKDLPSDFLYEILLKLGTESADDYIEYASIAFEERRKFSASQRYCIDFANSYFYICGSVGQTQTVYLYYIYETPEITLTSSPVWPTKFQRLIPYLMSEIWKAGVDADVLNLQQALALSKPGQILYQAMRNWDSSLKLKSMNHSTPMGLRGGVRTSGIVPDSDLL